MKYSVVVVGGGPAGSTASHVLALNGIKVCLIEKATIPRDKLCGGLLTLRANRIYSKVFSRPWDSVIEYRSQGVKFFYNCELLNEVDNYKEFSFTTRKYFDAFLVDQAKEQGTDIIENSQVIDIDLSKNLLRLSDDRIIEADYIIGADGVHSITRRIIAGKGLDKSVLALGVEVNVPRNDIKVLCEMPEIYFGVIKWGYGWIFPKKDSLTVGIAGLISKNRSIVDTFKRFYRDKFCHELTQRIKSHHIPFGTYVKRPGYRNVLLCGDAAGLVDPITGEGIAYAMQSGHDAALSVTEALNAKNPDATQGYFKRYKVIVSDLRMANLLRYLLFPHIAERAFVKALPQTDSIPRMQIDLMCGDLKYRDYASSLIAKIVKGSFKHFLGIGT